MSEKDIRNLILLGVGGFAIYMLFFRKTAVALPFPTSVTVTPRVTAAPPPAQLVGGVWQPGAGGFPATPDDSGASTYGGQNYDYVLTE